MHYRKISSNTLYFCGCAIAVPRCVPIHFELPSRHLSTSVSVNAVLVIPKTIGSSYNYAHSPDFALQLLLKHFTRTTLFDADRSLVKDDPLCYELRRSSVCSSPSRSSSKSTCMSSFLFYPLVSYFYQFPCFYRFASSRELTVDQILLATSVYTPGLYYWYFS